MYNMQHKYYFYKIPSPQNAAKNLSKVRQKWIYSQHLKFEHLMFHN